MWFLSMLTAEYRKRLRSGLPLFDLDVRVDFWAVNGGGFDEN